MSLTTKYSSMTIASRGVRDMYSNVLRRVYDLGELQDSRNGKVKAVQFPMITTVDCPWERVLLDPDRDANPFFHLFEALWMLAGSQDVAFVSRFNSTIGQFSDDGVTFNAAYGHRWRNHFGVDQLLICMDKLRANPLDRQVVMTMWDVADLTKDTKDKACNQQVMWRVVHGHLNMLTTNRSNDVVWGLTGANFVHMTMLHEFMALSLGYKVGKWTHVSNNAHLYERHFDLARHTPVVLHWLPYGGYQPLLAAGEDPMCFLADCQALCDGQDDDFATEFFDQTVAPMVQAFEQHRNGNKEQALYDAKCVEANDWRAAAVQWLKRRK